ncbi:MAG: caspase family protein [Bacteroidota bacterium]
MTRFSKLIRSTTLLLLVVSTQVFSQKEPYIEQLGSVDAFKGPIYRGAASINGRIVAATSTEKNVKLYDGLKLSETSTIIGMSNRVSSLSFSSSGQLLVTGGVDGQVVIWNVPSGAAAKTLSPHSGGIAHIAVQDENLILTVGIDRSIKLTDANTAKTVNSLGSIKEEIGALALHPNGKTFAIGTVSGLVQVYNLAQMTLVRAFTDTKERISSLVFTSDGKYLVAGGADGNVYVWDYIAQSLKTKLSVHKSTVYTLASDPKSRWIVSASSDSTLRFTDLVSLTTTKTLVDKDAYITFASFVSDELLVAGTSRGSLKSWKVLPEPPDTASPAIVMLQPCDGQAVKVFSKDFTVQGIAFDDNEVGQVTVNGTDVPLTQPAPAEIIKVPVGFKAKKFSYTLKLDSTGTIPFQVKVTDKFAHTVTRNGFVSRLSNDQAVEVVKPVYNSETDRTSAPIQFKTWFDVSSYSLAVNLIDIVTNQTVIGKGPGDVITDEVPLVVGYNQIELKVRSKTGERFSKTIGVTRKISDVAASIPSQSATKKERGSGPQKWAVIVGVSEYANAGIPKLTYADKDAESFANFLRRPEGGSYDADHMRVYLNKEATLANVRDGLMVFLQQAIDIDLVVIYFAGHGAPDPTRPQNLYLLTYDSDPNKLATSAFPMWDIQTVMSRQLAAKKSVIFSDACHSGGISVDVATRGLGATEQNPINQFLVDLSKSKDGSVIFTASAAGEVSQEFPDLGHGAFTYYLLEGLDGKADYNNDQTVTINELMQYVEEQVKRKTRGAQNPTRSQTNYDKDLPMAIILK